MNKEQSSRRMMELMLWRCSKRPAMRPTHTQYGSMPALDSPLNGKTVTAVPRSKVQKLD